MAAHRIRLYRSALAGVTYVYGGPVRFSAKAEDLDQRAADKACAIMNAEARELSRLDRSRMEQPGSSSDS